MRIWRDLCLFCSLLGQPHYGSRVGPIFAWQIVWGGRVRRFWRRMWLFLRIVGREWEPKSTGIPEPYRSHYRLSPAVAWDVARTVHR